MFLHHTRDILGLRRRVFGLVALAFCARSTDAHTGCSARHVGAVQGGD